MTFATLIIQDNIAISTCGTILDPGEVRDMATSVALIQECKQFCATQRADADAYRQEQTRQGYDDGLASAGVKYAKKLIDTEAEIVKFWSLQEDRLTEIMVNVLLKLAPLLSAKDLIRDLVTQAVKEVRQERWLVVRVHPDNVTATQTALKDIQKTHPHITNIETSGNADLALTDCIIESPNGFVNASWTVQINALKNIFQSFAKASVQEHSSLQADTVKKKPLSKTKAALS
jgi:flagellar biosynthesis/type III secretory pathway protein FliH